MDENKIFWVTLLAVGFATSGVGLIRGLTIGRQLYLTLATFLEYIYLSWAYFFRPCCYRTVARNTRMIIFPVLALHVSKNGSYLKETYPIPLNDISYFLPTHHAVLLSLKAARLCYMNPLSQLLVISILN